MGVVYKALDPSPKRTVAIKVLGPEVNETPVFRTHFNRECQILGELDIDGIVPIYDYKSAQDRMPPYFVMQWIYGEELQKYCTSHKKSLDERIGLIIQLSRILIQLHKRNLIHRDIKPSNVMVNQDGKIRLLDFGIAKVLGDTQAIHTTLDGRRPGTPAYQAPDKESTPASDMFSLGVLTYEILCGDHPYADAPESSIFPPLRTWIPDINPDVEQIVLQALEFREANRPDAKDFADKLESTLGKNDKFPRNGMNIGTYRNLKKIVPNDNDTAAIYRATVPSRDGYVAIKVLRRPCSAKLSDADTGNVQYPNQENQNIPSLVTVVDQGKDSGWYYAVVRWTDGVDLACYCQSQTITVEEKIQLLINLAHIVSDLHQKDMVHGGIECSHVIVAENQEILLYDFGIANQFGNNLSEAKIADRNHPLLTGFMYPEKKPEKASDVYSLGILAYYLLSGEFPYPWEYLDLHEVTTIVRAEDRTPLHDHIPTIDPKIGSVIMMALEKNPKDRPQAKQFADDLASIIESDGISPEDLPRIAHYKVLQIIESDELSTLYRATDLRNNHEVAIKLVHSSSSEKLSTYITNAPHKSAGPDLKIPGIVPLEDQGEYRGCYFFVGKWILGKDLLSYCNNGLKTIKDKIGVCLKLARIVADLHMQKCNLGGIEPRNVRVTNDGDVNLFDFGVANEIGNFLDPGRTMDHSNPTTDTDLMGSTLEEADVYSLGLLVYLILKDEFSGDWENHDIAEVSKGLGEESLQRESSGKRPLLLPEVEKEVFCALEKDGSFRQTAKEFLKTIEWFFELLNEYPNEGSKLGRYKNLRMIKIGLAFVLFKARDSVDNQDVAIKVLRPWIPNWTGLDPKWLKPQAVLRRGIAKIPAEANTIEPGFKPDLNLAGLLSARDMGKEKQWIYFVAEWTEGEYLDSYCRFQKGSLEERIKLVIKLARIIASLHAQKYIHNGVKASNVVVTNQGEIVLYDFGIINDVENNPFSYREEELLDPDFFGCWLPEKGFLTTASDVYCLGFLAYNVITGGQLPYDYNHKELMPTYTLDYQWKPPIPLRKRIPDINHKVERVIMKALRNRPKSRPTAEQFANQLELALKKYRGRSKKVLKKRESILRVSRQAMTKQRYPGKFFLTKFLVVMFILVGIIEIPNKFRKKNTPLLGQKPLEEWMLPGPSDMFDDWSNYDFKTMMKKQPYTIPNLSLKFRPIPAGSFMMGSSYGEEDEKPVHQVVISRPFWMGRYEVTRLEYAIVMGKDQDEISPRESTYPVVNVSFDDALKFCHRLTMIEEKSGRLPDFRAKYHTNYVYRLPTEAEWEYACRSDSITEFWYGSNKKDLIQYGNFGYYYDASQKIKALRNVAADDGYNDLAWIGRYWANNWGLCDMHGNVSEFCVGAYLPYDVSQNVDPLLQYNNPSDRVTPNYIIRGGSWKSSAYECRSAKRDVLSSHEKRREDVGFRVVLGPRIP